MSLPGNSDEGFTPGADQYSRRKERGDCTRCGKRPASEDSQYCGRCRRKVARIKKRSDERRREARRDAKQCVDCGSKSETYRCKPCSVRQGRLAPPETLRSTAGADQTKYSADYDGRVRYRGQSRRGAPPKEESDRLDLDMAEKSFARAKAGFALATAEPEGQDRQALWSTAIGQLSLTRRLIEDIERRNSSGNRAVALQKRAARARAKTA